MAPGLTYRVAPCPTRPEANDDRLPRRPWRDLRARQVAGPRWPDGCSPATPPACSPTRCLWPVDAYRWARSAQRCRQCLMMIRAMPPATTSCCWPLHWRSKAISARPSPFTAGIASVWSRTSTTGIREAARGIAGLLHNGAFPPGYHYAHQGWQHRRVFSVNGWELGGPCYRSHGLYLERPRAAQRQAPTDAGLCDAVLCGGVDSLSDLTPQGFTALEATSDESLCNRATATASTSARRRRCF